MRRPEPRLIIFDLDEVLVDLDHRVRLQHLAAITGRAGAELHAAIWGSDFERRAEAGEHADGAAYLRAFNARIGYDLSRGQWIEARRAAMRVRADVLAFAGDMAACAPVALLTNNGPLLKEALPELVPQPSGLPLFAVDAVRAISPIDGRAHPPRRATSRGTRSAAMISWDDSSSPSSCGGARAGVALAYARRRTAALRGRLREGVQRSPRLPRARRGRFGQSRMMLPSSFFRIILVLAAIGFAACEKKSEQAGTPSEEKPMSAQIVFKDAAGRELTTKDLEGASGKVRWEIVGAGEIPPEASRLHEQGREAGARGEYVRALDLFERAHRLAPLWPYPVYDAAFTHLMEGDSIKAEERYAEVDRMAPRGFFTAKTSLDCLRRERGGALPPGFCKAFASLEWMDDKIQKRAALEAIVAKFPAFPAAWKELCSLLEDDDARLRAITKGLEHEPDGETKGMLLINKALVLRRRGDRDGAIKILGELALDPQSTLGTEVLAKATLAQLVKG